MYAYRFGNKYMQFFMPYVIVDANEAFFKYYNNV